MSPNQVKRWWQRRLFSRLVAGFLFVAAIASTAHIHSQMNSLVATNPTSSQGKSNLGGTPSPLVETSQLQCGDKLDTEIDKSPHIVSILIPVYNAAPKTLSRVLQSALNQTYSPIEIIVSIDRSTNADESHSFVEDFIRKRTALMSKPEFTHRVHVQKERLHWIHNTNFLLQESTGDYVTILADDDWIPKDYIAKLAKCLDENPSVVNCYPYIQNVRGEGMNRKFSNRFVLSSIQGTQPNRVDEATSQCCAVSHRGLVRRSLDGLSLLPQTSSNFYLSDIILSVHHSVAGKLKHVDVPYFKVKRGDSVYNKMAQNRNDTTMREAHLESLTQLYNYAHSFASSSNKIYKSVSNRLQKSGMRDLTHQLDEQIRKTKRVAILGAGIQGCMLALMFIQHGYDVTVYDKSSDIMNRASAHGEGKIHLGLVYNRDLTLKTGTSMLESALRFSSYVDYLLGEKVDWDGLCSENFSYLLPYSSTVSPSEFEQYSTKLEKLYHELLSKDPTLSYLGKRPSKLVRRVPKLSPALNMSFFQAQYATAEYSISSAKLKGLIKEAFSKYKVKLVLGRQVLDVVKNQNQTQALGKMRVKTNVSEHDFDLVANALWEGRYAIDRKLGVNFQSGRNYRFKCSIQFPYMEAFSTVPSATIINGAFGDFVQFPQDSKMYFSYYPVARLGMTNNETEMKMWEDFADGRYTETIRTRMIDEHQEAFRMLFPYVKDEAFQCPQLGGGYILGNGATDIDDNASGLHSRSDYPFIISDGYISVATQKFTSAPHNAYKLEEALFVDENPKR